MKKVNGGISADASLADQKRYLNLKKLLLSEILNLNLRIIQSPEES